MRACFDIRGVLDQALKIDNDVSRAQPCTRVEPSAPASGTAPRRPIMARAGEPVGGLTSPVDHVALRSSQWVDVCRWDELGVAV